MAWLYTFITSTGLINLGKATRGVLSRGRGLGPRSGSSPGKVVMHPMENGEGMGLYGPGEDMGSGWGQCGKCGVGKCRYQGVGE